MTIGSAFPRIAIAAMIPCGLGALGGAAFQARGASPPAPVTAPFAAPAPLPSTFASGVQVPPPPPAKSPVHPLAHLSDAEIALKVRTDLPSLGPLSVGRPNRGALINGVALPEGPFWQIVERGRHFGTHETVAALTAAVTRVNEQFPGSHRLYIGHISGERGGYLRPHRSHQSGRDVDLGYYYRDGEKWYENATAGNLDTARTWALIKALLTMSDVEFLFMDRSVEALILDYARGQGEDADWLDAVFNGTEGRKDAVIRHTWGHKTHFHVRFAGSVARESAFRAYPALVKQRVLARSGYYGRGAKSWR